MDDKQLLALARKNAARAQAQEKRRKSYDATLDATRPARAEHDAEADKLFKEMKRREF